MISLFRLWTLDAHVANVCCVGALWTPSMSPNSTFPSSPPKTSSTLLHYTGKDLILFMSPSRWVLRVILRAALIKESNISLTSSEIRPCKHGNQPSLRPRNEYGLMFRINFKVPNPSWRPNIHPNRQSISQRTTWKLIVALSSPKPNGRMLRSEHLNASTVASYLQTGGAKTLGVAKARKASGCAECSFCSAKA